MHSGLLDKPSLVRLDASFKRNDDMLVRILSLLDILIARKEAELSAREDVERNKVSSYVRNGLCVMVRR
jgi:hypothetical protein